MAKIHPEIEKVYGNKLRVRVMGLLIEDQEVLTLVHLGLKTAGYYFPPGGGVEPGETLEEALKREFEEEIGITVEVGELIATHQFIDKPLHAVEVLFKVTKTGTKSLNSLSFDPEMPRFKMFKGTYRLKISEIEKLPDKSIHPLLKGLKFE